MATDIAGPDWSGPGAYRVLIHLPADGSSGTGLNDQQVATCRVEFGRWLKDQGIGGVVDLATLHLHRYDARTGKPVEGISFASAESEYDWPCRYEDDRLPENYPSRVGRASETVDGRPMRVWRLRKDRLFNREMDAAQGRLVWAHADRAPADATYALYFDVVPKEKTSGISPAPWIGDADVLRRRAGAPLGGFSHFTAAVGDLNGDGLDDIVAGTEKGDLVWYPNRGTPAEPRYLACRVLQDDDGPIDTGWYAAPFVYDWDDDGLLDLLVGTSGNVILWWRNVGGRKTPRFAHRGFVTCDGGRLKVPEAPVAEDPTGIFGHDYYNQPWVGDYDGDSLPDIVTGGYTTGQIFWYQAHGRRADGTPKLRYAGTLDTAAGAIDAVWAASPYVADFNADGCPDLLTGGWWWSGITTPPAPQDADLLRFYSATRNGRGMQFRRRQFPRRGEFPPGHIARPMLSHCNRDNLPDLLVSHSGGAMYLAPNVGTPGNPVWKMPEDHMTAPWAFTRDWDAAACVADVNGDGISNVLTGNVLWTAGGDPRSPTKTRLGAVHVEGVPIDHAGPGYGDHYAYTILYDWNADGQADILWGTHQGNVFVHLHRVGGDPLAFGPGTEVRLTSGEPLRVGPPPVDSADAAADFTTLQGSRIVFAVHDFDQDGIADLIVGDTYAQLWVFLGRGDHAARTFRPGIVIAQLPTRPDSIGCTDWNGDGKPDLLIGGTASEPGTMYSNASRPGRPAVHPRQTIENLPYLFWGPRLRAVDWNRDGDDDLMVQSEFFSFWIERSFLDRGYRRASVLPSNQEELYIQQRPVP